MLYSQESGSIRSPINAEAFPLVIWLVKHIHNVCCMLCGQVKMQLLVPRLSVLRAQYLRMTFDPTAEMRTESLVHFST